MRRAVLTCALSMVLAGCLTKHQRREVKVYRTDVPDMAWVVVTDEQFADGLFDDDRSYFEALFLCARTGANQQLICFSAKWEDAAVPPSIRDRLRRP